MARNLKEALERNRMAAEELDRALRECIAALREAPEAGEAQLRVIEGGRRVAGGRARRGMG